MWNFVRDSLIIALQYKLNNNQFSLDAISHKELNTLMKKAKKENLSIKNPECSEVRGNQEFNELITEWTESSKKILLMLNKNEQGLQKNRNPKSLMAFGAMGAHIDMALQALKATEFDH